MKKGSDLALDVGRKSADTKLTKCGVVASGFGRKMTDGKPLDQICIRFHVLEKKIESDLNESDIIPPYLTRYGKTFPTDVVDYCESPVDQYGSRILDVERMRLGTISCYGRRYGRQVLVTCAHNILGSDGMISTPTPVRALPSPTGHWVEIGSETVGNIFSGSGTGAEQSRFDGAFMPIIDSDMSDHFDSLINIMPYTYYHVSQLLHIQNLLGQRVHGVGTTTGTMHGIIDEVLHHENGECWDVVIVGDQGQPLTSAGDSGTLWINDQGEAIAIHLRGYDSHLGSMRAYGMFLERITKTFRIEDLRYNPLE